MKSKGNTVEMIKFLQNILKYIRFYGGSFTCNVCNKPVRRFFPFSESLQKNATRAGFPYDFRRMETLNYDNCNCPFCLSSDRERLYKLFLDERIQNQNGELSILDFSPNATFSAAMKGTNGAHYTSADFLKPDFDLQLDICNMSSIQDNQFDVLICSHILEHVQDTVKALFEIRRVLKPGAMAIIMVPIFLDVKQTVEDPAHVTALSRQKYYGQDDHVRLFSKSDFLERITNAGFTVHELDVSHFPSDKIKQFAIARNSALYVCMKR